MPTKHHHGFVGLSIACLLWSGALTSIPIMGQRSEMLRGMEVLTMVSLPVHFHFSAQPYIPCP